MLGSRLPDTTAQSPDLGRLPLVVRSHNLRLRHVLRRSGSRTRCRISWMARAMRQVQGFWSWGGLHEKITERLFVTKSNTSFGERLVDIDDTQTRIVSVRIISSIDRVVRADQLLQVADGFNVFVAANNSQAHQNPLSITRIP